MENKSFKILSYNIDTNMGRLENGPMQNSHNNFRVINRLQYIINFVKQMDCEIVHLQEGRKCLDIDPISKLNDTFMNDYHVIIRQLNPSEYAFYYISLYKKSRFDIIKSDSYYLTETPFETKTLIQLQEYKEANNNKEILTKLKEKWTNINGYEEFEKSLSWSLLYDKETNTHLVAVNCHIGLGAKHRAHSSHKINDFVKNIKTITGIETNNIVLCGDFNTIPLFGREEQLEVLKSESLIDLTDNLQYIPDYRTSMDSLAMDVFENTFNFFHMILDYVEMKIHLLLVK